MKRKLTALVSVLLCFCVTLSANAAFAVNEATPAYAAQLKFHENGDFRILQLADIQDGVIMLEIVKDYLKDIVPATNPDLILLTGDNFSGGSANTGVHAADLELVKKGIDQFMSILDGFGIPVAVVFGNHDGETTVTKEEQMAIYSQYSCCIGFDEGESIYGCGTYNIPIYSSAQNDKIAYNIWMVDSNMYDLNADGSSNGYDYVHQDQIDWYVNTSNALKAQNGGVPVPSMMFQHIIVNEVYDALLKVPDTTPGAISHNGNSYILNPDNTISGVMHEAPCPSKTNSGQFDAVVNQGDVVAMVFGHDHVNSFQLTYKGVDLITTPGVTFNSYGDEGRGSRIIDIKENSRAYSTEVVTYKELYEDDASAEFRFDLYGNEGSTFSRIGAFIMYLISMFIPSFFD